MGEKSVGEKFLGERCRMKKYMDEEKDMGAKSEGKDYIVEETLGGKSGGEMYMVEQSVGETYMGEKSAGEKNVGKKCSGENPWVKIIWLKTRQK